MRQSFKPRATMGIAAALVAVVAGSASISSALGSAPTHVIIRSSPAVTVPFSGPINRQARAFCNSGETVIAGGAAVTGIGTSRGEYFTAIVRDTPLPESQTGVRPTGWLAEATNNSARLSSQGGEDSVLRAYVVCSS